jgi:uncharacterized membrane protein
MLKHYALSYGAILLTYLVLDGIWLGLVAKESYTQAMHHVMRDRFPVWPWAAFYLTYGAAIVYLVVMRHPTAETFWPVLITGAVLGMAAYGAYNLTCYALIEGWPLPITLKDWLWGTTVTAIASVVGWKAWAFFSASSNSTM